MLVVQLFLNATILVFAWCAWPIPDPTKLYLFVGCAHFLLALGYFFGLRKGPKSCRFSVSWKSIVLVGIVFTLITTPLVIYSNTGGEWTILSGITNPGTSYNESMLRVREGGSQGLLVDYIGHMRMVFGVLVNLVLPIGAMFWSRLGTSMKVGVVAAALAHILESTSAGANKGFADIIVMLPWLILIQKRAVISTLLTFRNLVTCVVIGLIFIGFLFYFTRNIAERGNYQKETLVYSTDGHKIYNLNLGSQLMDTELESALLPIVSYTTQGYYGLACSLELPFEWTYGVGNSRILISYADKYIATPGFIYSKTYAQRVEGAYGWDSYSRWHTVYPWLAGDLTFPGTLVAVFFVGLIFAMTWRDTLEANNFFAVNLFGYLVIALFYFSANNQVLQFHQTAISFWVALALWLIYRRVDLAPA
jgi:hypothetical protein